MTKEQIVNAWGPPSSKEVVPPGDELWTYGGKQIAFTDGVVTYAGE